MNKYFYILVGWTLAWVAFLVIVGVLILLNQV